jgi:diguanylate cyclase (GGDEF)-like protein
MSENLHESKQTFIIEWMADDRLFFSEEKEQDQKIHPRKPAWKILIVDDEEEVHRVTKFALNDVIILDRKLEFLSADSAKEAKQILHDEGSGIAVILLDVVMEREDAGFEVVEYIRKTLKNYIIRIILRTGHPGSAPELKVIHDYDINDYKTKSELTQTRLVTSLTAALRSYDQLETISKNRQGLEYIVSASAELFSQRAMNEYTKGVLTQIAALLRVGPEGIICVKVLDSENIGPYVIIGAEGKYKEQLDLDLSELNNLDAQTLIEQSIAQKQNIYSDHATALYMESETIKSAVIYLETSADISDIDKKLLEVFVQNIAVGLENVQLFQNLRHYAYYDQLTDLPNITSFVQYIDKLLETEVDFGFDVVVLDIDNFATINEAFGHAVGDAILRAVSERLNNKFPDGYVSRLEGDIFGLVLQVADPDAIRSCFAQVFSVSNTEVPLNVTLGIFKAARKRQSGMEIYKNASIAMKRAKGNFRRPYLYFTDEMELESRSRVNLIKDMRKGISSDEFFPEFQPKIDLKSRKVVGFEALARWVRKDGKSISPVTFIEAAESSGLIFSFSKKIIQKVFQSAEHWINELGLDIEIAFNVSVHQFQDPDFLTFISDLKKKHSLPDNRLELEITESAIMNDIEEVVGIIEKIKKAGFLVAIDDFGTGFSSLSYLLQLPVDSLKIDRSFVENIANNQRSHQLSKTIVDLGKQLNLNVIAEGVEDGEMEKILIDLGCNQGQGWLYSRSLAADLLPGWIKAFEEKHHAR